MKETNCTIKKIDLLFFVEFMFIHHRYHIPDWSYQHLFNECQQICGPSQSSMVECFPLNDPYQQVRKPKTKTKVIIDLINELSKLRCLPCYLLVALLVRAPKLHINQKYVFTKKNWRKCLQRNWLNELTVNLLSGRYRNFILNFFVLRNRWEYITLNKRL